MLQITALPSSRTALGKGGVGFLPETQPCHCGQATQPTSGSVKGSSGVCVCMRVFASVCLCMYVCALHVCLRVSVFTLVCMSVCLHVYVVCTHTFMCGGYTLTFVHVCLHVFVCVCVVPVHMCVSMGDGW